MIEIVEKIAALSPEKRALLLKKIKEQGRQFNLFPLSFAQQRLWLLDKLAPGNPAYNIPSAFRLVGPLNIAVLEKSLNAIVQRHEILRTSFALIDDQPFQYVAKAGEANLQTIDISNYPEALRDEEIRKIMLQETMRAFDLMKGPLAYISLIRLNPDDHILVIVMHHIVSDGWSMGVLMREFSYFYRSFSTNVNGTLPPLKIQYADFAQWQRKWLEGERLDNLIAYWRKQLENPPVLKLPTDRNRPEMQAFRGGSEVSHLPAATYQKLQELSKKEETTDYMTLLTAFKVLLYRYSGQVDICVGTPIANRNRAEIESLIGFFVNTLVIRTDCAGKPSFRQLLQRVKKVCVDAYAHQDLPFEMLVETIQPDRDLSSTPLFQVLFVHQKMTTEEMPLPNFTISLVELENPTAKFDLTLRASETREGLRLALDYNSDIFTPATIRRILAHFVQLVTEIVSNPDEQIANYQMLTGAEREQVLSDWNQTALEYPRALCLHHLFEQQALKTPDDIAVVYEENSLGFKELNQRANQIALKLVKMGIGPDCIVGLHVERSLEMIVGLVAILKAGGAYVPLDVALPQDRLAYMIEDANIQVILTQHHLAENLAKMPTQVMVLDASAKKGGGQNPQVAMTSENLAYVIYTSGTTGKPKGVAVRHRSVINLLAALNQKIYPYEKSCKLKVSVNGPLAFDTSVKQIIQMMQGHTLYIVPEETRLDGEALLHFMRNNELDVFDCTPSQLQMIIDAGLLSSRGFVPGHMLVGGEPIDEAMWQQLASSPETTFHNVYGPTECTVDATVRSIGRHRSLGKAERVRYARQILLDEWGLDIQEQLKNLKVFVAGAGGSGSPILTQLALMGVGHIRICDFDVVDLSNLNRQFLHCVSDDSRIGMEKAISAKKTVHNINPHCKVDIFLEKIDAHNIDAMVGDADIIFDSVDDFPTKFVLSKCAVRKGVPHVFYGMMDINSFGGIFYPPKAPCFHCLFDSAKVAEMLEMEKFRNKQTGKRLPTPVFCSPVISSAAFMMTEAIKSLVGIGEPAYNRFFFFLQKGSEKLSKSRGVQSIRYWMSAYFEYLMKNQGFDFDLGGWRGKFLEELQVSRNPACDNCQDGDSAVHYSARRIKSLDHCLPVIGKPVANTQAYILDPNLNPVPVGVPGELYIGGDGLARGYLNRPDLTAEKFIPNLFSDISGSRLYKTGDMASFSANGDIRFFGRVDHQVKVRGYRIELGDIETALSSHPAIQDSVVLVKEEKPGDKRLVAYLITKNEHRPNADELREHVRIHLPDYMVPATFMFLSAFPLTINGKVDRTALLKIDHSHALIESDYEAPRTPTEELLADIWGRVLGRERVGIRENFFDIGGHSLLGTQLITRLRDTFNMELPLRVLFESPTIFDLARAIDHTKLKNSGIEAPPLVPVTRDSEQELPLSFGQLRLWFLDQLEPGSPFYNIPRAVRINGALDYLALEKSINEIVRRHEILRTIFQSLDGKPVQVIAPELMIEIPIVDLTGVPEADQQMLVEGLAQEEAQRSFDLATGPLLRLRLVKIHDQENVILMVMHHIVSDGWSSGIFIREIATCYDAFSSGNAPSLRELPIQYADYAFWQRQWLQGEVLDSQLSFWNQQLADSPPLLELPTDRPRPAVQTFHGAQYYFELPEELTLALKNLSSREGATLFMLLLAAYQTLLYRYSGQEDILVGSPIANRTRSETEALIGFFLNTIIFRTDLSGNPTFVDLLKRVRNLALDAYAHQDLPFEQVVDVLRPERNLSHTPLFQVMFVFQNTPRQAFEIGDLKFSFIDSDPGTAQFDLTLTMVERPDRLNGSFEYNTDLFDSATIQRMVENFKMLLAAVVEQPQKPIASLPLMPEAEMAQIVEGWNRTEAEVPRQCVHELFAAQANRAPDAIAVVFDHQQISYRELDRRANQLAQHLQKMGVRSEDIVGICIDRSLEMLVGLFGILKAGGAYVPIDPKYPQDRIRMMLEDSRANVLLTQEKYLEQLPEFTGKVLALDAAWTQIASESDQPPALAVKPEHLAYVIFTSGSTGRPKGVGVTHLSLANYTSHAVQEFAIADRDRILQFASISFDTAAEEIYPGLVSGARLVLRSEEMVSSIPVFVDACRELEITLLDLPTAFWHQMVLEMVAQNLVLPEAMRLVIIGGERAIPERVLDWKNRLDGRVRLFNTYGPTETTIVATTWELAQLTDPAILAREVPIGKPVHNLKAFVLDRYLNPQPVGVPGELYVGGLGLARGYLDRPDLTAERFVPNPFAQSSGERLYRTGDLVRFLADGNLQYFGRIDQQVKIRGFRIELGEIEATLAQHPDVKDAVVVATARKKTGAEEESGVKRLVAYLVPANESAIDVKGLRSFLKDRLPDYMIPAFFVDIPEIPLTQSGKINYRALPEPEHSRPELESSFTAPRTPVEETLAQILAQVLGVDRVGVNDNFFELGGDSILSIQLIARANQAGIKITPMQLFQYQTVASLAAVAQLSRVVQGEQGIVTGPVPLTPIQQWFFDQNFNHLQQWNQSILLAVNQPMKPEVLEKVVQHLLRHHDALRLRFERTDEGWYQVNADVDEIVPFTQIDLAGLTAAEQSARIEATAAEIQKSLNITVGPLLRVAYFDLGAGEPGRLLMVIHHLCVDAVSWRILMEDFQAAYAQASQGMEIVLPAKTTSFKQWAEQLHAYAQSEKLLKEADYWLSNDTSRIPQLPVDYIDGVNSESSVRRLALSFNENETRAILQEIPGVFHTQINEVLLTALAQAYAQWTGKRALHVDLEGHGRVDIQMDLDLSRTVGWFTNVYPVFLDIKNVFAPADVLKYVKEEIRRIPDHGIGFGLLRYLNENPELRQKLARIPVAQLSFNYLGQFNQGRDAGDQFGAAAERPGADHHPDEIRTYLIDVSGGVADGRLTISWSYSENLFRLATIERLAQSYMAAMRTLIEQMKTETRPGYTPSDFKLAKIDQKKLDKVLAKFNKK